MNAHRLIGTDRVGHVEVGDGAIMSVPLPGWLWQLEKSYEMSIKALEDERAKLVKPLDETIDLLKDRLMQLRRPVVTGYLTNKTTTTPSEGTK